MTPLTPEEEQAAIDWAKQVLDPDTGYGRGTKDWNMARALLSLKGKLERMQTAIWPGLPKFVSTPEILQQDFHEAIIESFRTQHENDKDELDELRAELTEARKQIAEPAPQTEGK